MDSLLLLNANIVNEGEVFESDLLVKGPYIEKIGKDLSGLTASRVLDLQGNCLFPGVIDDQVHFREPGLTHKATLFTESRAAVAGGVTSFMEMPNTLPPVFTQELLEDKYLRAAQHSLANYSFYIGASHDNLEEVLKTDIQKVCGLKIFMGSSTGNLLVDQPEALEAFFSKFPSLIATHCEDEATIRQNLEAAKKQFGDHIPMNWHAKIRSAEACFLSSSLATAMAKAYQTRLHILHISTGKEVDLFDPTVPLEKKKITAEACIHHLWFSDEDYDRLGSSIKWNPAVKTVEDREEIWKGLLENKIDVIATDHAPHTWEEKQHPYLKAPSGGPLIQHTLVAMLEFYHQKKISLPWIAEKMAHNPSIIFEIQNRGFIREGYYADLTAVNLHQPWEVRRENIIAKCGWSPFSGQIFKSKITHTLVSGHLAYENGFFHEEKMGHRILFQREKP